MDYSALDVRPSHALEMSPRCTNLLRIINTKPNVKIMVYTIFLKIQIFSLLEVGIFKKNLAGFFELSFYANPVPSFPFGANLLIIT